MAKKSRQCGKCGGRLTTRTTTGKRPYNYRISGLDNVLLAGIEVENCRRCGAESPTIPQIVALHTAIAKTLIDKATRLSGQELRFLRKNLGLPSKTFAKIMQLTPETLSAAENGRRDLGAPTDRLAKLAIGVMMDLPGLKERLTQDNENEGRHEMIHPWFQYDDAWLLKAG